MFRGILVRLSLVCAFAVVLCPQGCRKVERASAADPASEMAPGSVRVDNPVNEKVAAPAPKRAEYANDLDRLAKLTEQVNRVCRIGFVVTFGTGDLAPSGRVLTVDYALFDRLGDDGAAVLVAEAIEAAGPKQPSYLPTNSPGNNAKVLLESDEDVGRYVARAGFGPDGFAEWLMAKELSATGPQPGGVPEKMRIAAFMRGYQSENSGRAR